MKFAILALLSMAGAVTIKTTTKGIYDGGDNFGVKITTDSHSRKMCDAG